METGTLITLLAGAMVWGLVQMLWASTTARFEQGFDWGMGPRDEPRAITGKAARLDRAYRNFLETFPIFAAATLAAIILGRADTLVIWGAHLYLWSRIAYTILYFLGTPLVRTIVWIVSIIGIAMIIAVLFG